MPRKKADAPTKEEQIAALEAQINTLILQRIQEHDPERKLALIQQIQALRQQLLALQAQP